MASVTRASMDQKLAMAKRCSRGIYIYYFHIMKNKSQFSSRFNFMAEGVVAGAKAAVVASVAAAVPTVRKQHIHENCDLSVY